MKKVIRSAVFGIVILGVFVLLKNNFAQWAVETAVSRATHCPVHIGSTHVQLFRSVIDLRNIRVSNPPGFSDPTMIDIPHILIAADGPSFFKESARVKDLELDLKELVVVRNQSGQLNVNTLKPANPRSKRPAGQKENKSGRKIEIDHMALSIGRVVYKDYSAGGEPKIQTFEINIQNREYTHISDLTVVVSTVISEAIARTALANLAGLELGSFKSYASQALDESLGLVKTGSGAVEDTAKGILNLFK